MRHAGLSTEELRDNALDATTAHDGKRMAAVSRDDTVIFCDSVLKADGDCFL